MTEGNPVHIRWKNHKKYIRKGISFRPEYSELIDRLCAEQKITQRELIENALKEVYGVPHCGCEKDD
jgi:hypothetical protein